MHAERHAVVLTTDASGDATGYTPNVTGRVLSVQYVKDSFADGVDVDVTGEDTGMAIWDEDDVNASVLVAPRMAVHGTDGAALLYASEGEPVTDYIVLANERVKIVIANGGDTKTGTFYVTVG